MKRSWVVAAFLASLVLVTVTAQRLPDTASGASASRVAVIRAVRWI